MVRYVQYYTKLSQQIFKKIENKEKRKYIPMIIRYVKNVENKLLN